MQTLLISVVIAAYNERENLAVLCRRLNAALDAATSGHFEVVFVNDGSSDETGEMLQAIAADDNRYKVINLSRNFGHQAALQAGLDAASGSAVVLMDADLQDPPELLPKFIEKWREGFDVVYGIRRQRKESWPMRIAYAGFYRSMRWLSDLDTPLDAGDFCLLDAKVVRALLRLPERNRFLRGLRTWVGFAQTGIEYERNARNAGQPKYTLRKLITLAASGYIGFSATPLRLAAWLGVLCASVGFVMTMWVIISKLSESSVPQGWASTIAVILFVGGAQLVMLGVIGEYLARVYDEVRQRPLYLVRSRLGFSERAGESSKNS